MLINSRNERRRNKKKLRINREWVQWTACDIGRIRNTILDFRTSLRTRSHDYTKRWNIIKSWIYAFHIDWSLFHIYICWCLPLCCLSVQFITLGVHGHTKPDSIRALIFHGRTTKKKFVANFRILLKRFDKAKWTWTRINGWILRYKDIPARFFVHTQLAS